MVAGVLKSYVDIENKGVTAFRPEIIQADKAVSVPGDFATVQEAITSFDNVAAVNGAIGIINVAAGTHTINASLAFNNGFNLKLTIQGAFTGAAVPALGDYSGVKATDRVTFSTQYPTIFSMPTAVLVQGALLNVSFQHVGFLTDVSSPICFKLTAEPSNVKLTNCGFFGFSKAIEASAAARIGLTKVRFAYTRLLLSNGSTTTAFQTLHAYGTGALVRVDVNASLRATVSLFEGGPSAIRATTGAALIAVSCQFIGQTATTVFVTDGAVAEIRNSTFTPASSFILSCRNNAYVLLRGSTATVPTRIQALTGATTKKQALTGTITYFPALNTMDALGAKNVG